MQLLRQSSLIYTAGIALRNSQMNLRSRSTNLSDTPRKGSLEGRNVNEKSCLLTDKHKLLNHLHHNSQIEKAGDSDFFHRRQLLIRNPEDAFLVLVVGLAALSYIAAVYIDDKRKLKENEELSKLDLKKEDSEKIESNEEQLNDKDKVAIFAADTFD